MSGNQFTPTLLHAILKNQHALADAIGEIANWMEDKGSPLEAHSVRAAIQLIEDNRAIIGRCIADMMKPS